MNGEKTESKIEQQREVRNPKSGKVHHSSHDLDPSAQPKETLPVELSCSPHFLFGNKNGLEPLFELLTLKDLCTLRQTCKQFKKVIDEFIVHNYPAVRIGYRQIDICYRDLEKYVGLDENSIKVIKRLQVFMDNFPCLWDEVPDLLRQVEMVKLRNWSIRGEFYEAFLQYCPNLEHLFIWNIYLDKIMGTGNEWLLRHYPSIKHLELDESDVGVSGNGREIIELKTFFQLNPNVRTFSTIPCFLYENRNWLRGSNIHLDQLNLKCDFYLGEYMEPIWELVNELYEQGFYKRFHFYGYYFNHDIIGPEKRFSIRSLEKLHFQNEFDEVRLQNLIILLPPLINLKELFLMCFKRNEPESSSSNEFVQNLRWGIQMVSRLFLSTEFDRNLETLASSLTNVERIHIRRAKFDDILPFIRRSPKVKEIRIDRLKDGYYMKNNIIDVKTLNNLRKQLIRASKITLYVREEVYLATKLTRTTKSSMIILKRTFEWPHQTLYSWMDY